MVVTFIGGGTMATAVAGGIVGRGTPASALRFIEVLPEARARLEGAFPGARVRDRVDAETPQGADVVVLAVKPQVMKPVCESLAGKFPSAAVAVSIAAGIRTEQLDAWLGGTRAVVRAMPNTPALIGKGISGAFAAEDVDAAGRAAAAAVLEAAGQVLWVAKEADLDAVTAVSGSGPAYVYYFIEALEEAARAQGFPAADARRLALATFDGAVTLAQRSPHDPATLRTQVTTKGGTTAAALATMEAAAVKSTIAAAVTAACRRARELGDAYGSDS